MKIPLSRPDITEKERKAISQVLKTPYLSLGPKLSEFEKKFARYIGTKYAIAVSNGTCGLHLGLRALGISDGDEIITTPFSFIASSNSILFERAIPVFCDIDPETFNINPDKIETKITKKTKAILAVDVFGYPCDWDKLQKIARKYNLKLIEDSCEALGAFYNGQKCGTFGDIGVFAFYPNKQMTTGEGGMIVTNDKKIADYARSASNQGRNLIDKKPEFVILGYNYRLDEMSAALGIAQLLRIKSMLKKREKVAKLYTKLLSKIDGVIVPSMRKSWFVYVIRVKNRDKIMEKLQKKGIGCSHYFPAIHLQPIYQNLGYLKGDFPITEKISSESMALPFYNNLTLKEITTVVNTLSWALKKS